MLVIPKDSPIAGHENRSSMEALVCHKLYDPAEMSLQSIMSSESSPITLNKDHPIPQLCSPTSVRVRVKATSLNYANFLQIMGKYQERPPLPFIPGSDYSGTVESVGPAVTAFKIGDRVCSVTSVGSFAQFIVADESQLFRVPEECDLVAAAALPVAFGTSHIALVHRAQLTSAHVLLVLGAAGGVGFSALQIAKVCGAVVVAVARGSEKVQFLRSLGIDHVVDTSKENLTTSIKDFLKTRKLKGVDVLYDPVGGQMSKESLRLLNWGAQILIIGFASGEVPVIPANVALIKNWTIHGLYWVTYEFHKPTVLQESLRELLLWMAKGLIRVHISHAYSLSEAGLAFSAIKERKAMGKVVIVMGHESTTSKL